MKPFTVDIYSDVVCPWCYVGKRYIDKAFEYYASAYEGERQPEVRWLPFMLNASLPREGVDREAYLKHKYPGRANDPTLFADSIKAASRQGIEARFDLIQVQPNTLDAHRLMRFAEQRGLRAAVAEPLYRAYFVEGRNLSSLDVLAEIGIAAGLDAEELRAYLASDVDVDWVKAEDQEAKRLGITTVPFLVLNGEKGFSGNQAPDKILEALKWARRDAVRPKWLPSFF
jgi:predicted DsbA family dithiol-disulfide isomerase